MAELRYTVEAGGVIYAAGTPETEELREVIDARHWTDGAASATPSPGSSSAELDALRQLAAQELGERDATIASLTEAAEQTAAQLVEKTGMLATAQAEVARLTEENDQLKEQVAEIPPPSQEPGAEPYKGWKASQLSSEIEKRNTDRDPAGDRYIVVKADAERPELLAALQADDARTDA